MKKIEKIIVSLAILISLCASSTIAFSQTIECEPGEYFWGISSSYGSYMPLGKFSREYNFSDSIRWNLSSPLLISNKGRYVVSNSPIIVKSDTSSVKLDSQLNIVSAGNSLRQTYLLAVSKNFRPVGKSPSLEMLNLPSYNSWVGIGSSLSQSALEDYANGIINSSLKPGVIVINNGWQNYNGSFDFNFQRFHDPKKLIQSLHSKGFKVMLEIMPLFSLDCLEFVDFKDSGMLETNEDGTVCIVPWYGGYSAVLDLSSEKTVKYLQSKLDNLLTSYGVDGFKFDYVYSNQSCNSSEKYLSRIKPWTDLAANYNYNQVKCVFKYKNFSSLVGHLEYKDQNWHSIVANIEEAVNAGLCSFPFFVADPIGGGFVDKIVEPDYKLIVRQAQMQAFFPIMNFSLDLWNKMPKDLFQAVVEAQKLHEKLLPYIQELASSASTTGEPIIRSMAYTFPGKGFYDCMDQFMLGNRYLVAPVLSPDNVRKVRLPAGTWIDDSGKRYKGPAVLKVNVPVERVLYFKASKDIKQK